uniref:Uncharacterized protein n=1 Tax=Trypanosoma vivax (strain Y486) TaxID=1055687 RepID=G0U1Y9_TRYVY|nr:hypothetical protein TVY486_0901130 [Trypanosoma vivax Y486]
MVFFSFPSLSPVTFVIIIAIVVSLAFIYSATTSKLLSSCHRSGLRSGEMSYFHLRTFAPPPSLPLCVHVGPASLVVLPKVSTHLWIEATASDIFATHPLPPSLYEGIDEKGCSVCEYMCTCGRR